MDVSSSMNEFALDLFNSLRGSNPDDNILMSPISVVTALSMTLLGTAENTEKEMIECLKLKDKKLIEWHEVLGAFLTTLKAGVGNKASPMNVANKIFVDKDYEVLKSYTGALTKHYKSEYGSVSFRSDPTGAVKAINGWVKQETKDKIPNLLDSLDTMTRVVLVNAVHFKGFWKDAFEKGCVTNAKFHVNSNKMMDIKMMYKKIKVPYSETDYALAIELPFKEEGYSMHFILPKERFGLKKLEEKLLKDKSSLDAFLNSSSVDEVEISIPKFQMKSNFNLVDQLKALGMKDLFDERLCNLSGVSVAKDLYVSAVVHEACLDVTEDGAEAAAATAVMMVTCCLPEPGPIFYADHPFLVSINYKKSILFLGRVVEPNTGSN